MSLYQLKPQFQNLLRPCANWLASHAVTANQVTLFACFFSVSVSIFLVCVGQGVWWLLLPVTLFIRMALNAIDGMLAREHNMQSSLGLMLNEVGDLVADAAMYLAFLVVVGTKDYLLFGVVLLAWLSEFIAIIVDQVTGTRANQGPMGKSDRALVFGMLALLVAFSADVFDVSVFEVAVINGSGLGVIDMNVINAILSTIALLLALTVYRRAKCLC